MPQNLRQFVRENKAKAAEASAEPTEAQLAAIKKFPVSWETVKAACGHVVGMPVYFEDKHIDQRRSQVVGRKCDNCRQEDHKNTMAKEKARSEKNAAKRAKNAARLDDSNRLPDNSRFHMTYDAVEKEWFGCLVVPGFHAFQDTASGLFGLCKNLDQQYRAERSRRESHGSAGSPEPSPGPTGPHPGEAMAMATQERAAGDDVLPVGEGKA